MHPRFRTATARSLVILIVGAFTCMCFVAAASVATFAPPRGKVWHGLTGSNPASHYQGRVRKHVAVRGTFIRWGSGYERAVDEASSSRSRLLLHVSTASGQHEPGVISPGAIARGRGDGYLLSLNRRIARHGHPVYLRWLGEMNNCDNAYSSRRCDGSKRGPNHSPARFKQAWRRAVLIVRGGEVASINRRLGRLGMRPLDIDAEELPRAPAAFVWSPMTGGSPMIRALRPAVFWPGPRYVDWVGTSFYSRFPNFRFLNPYYKRFAGRYRKPFAFVEWALWGAEDQAFVRRFFSWVRRHKRTGLITYNHGSLTRGPFVLRRYPRSAREIRRQLSSRRFLAWTPEWLD